MPALLFDLFISFKSFMGLSELIVNNPVVEEFVSLRKE